MNSRAINLFQNYSPTKQPLGHSMIATPLCTCHPPRLALGRNFSFWFDYTSIEVYHVTLQQIGFTANRKEMVMETAATQQQMSKFPLYSNPTMLKCTNWEVISLKTTSVERSNLTTGLSFTSKLLFYKQKPKQDVVSSFPQVKTWEKAKAVANCHNDMQS